MLWGTDWNQHSYEKDRYLRGCTRRAVILIIIFGTSLLKRTYWVLCLMNLTRYKTERVRRRALCLMSYGMVFIRIDWSQHWNISCIDGIANGCFGKPSLNALLCTMWGRETRYSPRLQIKNNDHVVYSLIPCSEIGGMLNTRGKIRQGAGLAKVAPDTTLREVLQRWVWSSTGT